MKPDTGAGRPSWQRTPTGEWAHLVDCPWGVTLGIAAFAELEATRAAIDLVDPALCHHRNSP